MPNRDRLDWEFESARVKILTAMDATHPVPKNVSEKHCGATWRTHALRKRTRIGGRHIDLAAVRREHGSLLPKSGEGAVGRKSEMTPAGQERLASSPGELTSVSGDSGPKRPRVIFLDDDPETIDAYRHAIQRASPDWNSVFHTSPAEALEAYRAHSAAVLVTDAYMPGLDGLDILRLAKEINPAACVIVVSGRIHRGAESVLSAAIISGAVKTFMKPVPMDELIQAIEELLKEK